MIRRFALSALVALFVFEVAAVRPAAGHHLAAAAIEIRHPWIRPVPPGAPAGAAYLTIVNRGARADRLLGGSTPVAGRFELHRMTMSGGVMTMRPVSGGLVIPARGTVVLEPGGFHAMLMNLKAPIRAGDRVTVTLVFERAGSKVVTFPVEQPR